MVSPSDLSSVWIAMDCVRDCGPINRLFFATGVVGDYLLDEPFADFVSALSLNGGRVPWRREGLSFALNDTSAVITSIRFNLSFNNNGTIPFTCNDHATEAHVFISGYSFFVLMNASFDVSFVGWSNYSCFASSFEHSSALGLLDTPIMCGSTLQVFQINGMKLIVYDASKNYNLTHLKTAVLHASLALKDLKIEVRFN